MTNRATSPKLPGSSASSETSADKRYAEAVKALKERHKEAKQQLKQQLALELAEEQAEVRRQEDRRNYLLGQALRGDLSEAALALASTYMKRMTHPSDRKLFGLPPLPAPSPESGDGDAASPVGEVSDQDGREDDALSADAGGEIPDTSDVDGQRDRSEAAALPGIMKATSESSPIRREGRADDAVGEVPPGVGGDRSDAVMPGPDERIGMDHGNVDPDRDRAENPASSSIATLGHVGGEDGGTRVQATAPTAAEQVPVTEPAARPSFMPRAFLSQAELRNQIDQTGAKRSKLPNGQWIATASTLEQADRLEALKLQLYES